MEILLLLAAIVVVAVLATRAFRRDDPNDDGSSDFEVLGVEFTPPAGSQLKAGTRIVAKFRYRYSRPAVRLRAWAQLRENGGSSYEPSGRDLAPGTGTVSRWVQLDEPGRVRALHLIVSDAHNRDRYRQRIEVDFEYVDDPELARLREDGAGARVHAVRFSPPSGSTLAAGQTVAVEIDFEIASERGLNIWAMPLCEDDETTSFAPSMQLSNGRGTAKRWIQLGTAGDLHEVLVTMANVAGRTVFEETIPVDFRFR